MKPLRRRATSAAVVLAVCLGGAVPARAAPPRPVFAPVNGFPDPSVVNNNDQFYGMATGSNVPSAQGNIATGPWTGEGPALNEKPSWATHSGMWAPDLERIGPNEWVLYFAAPVAGLDSGQRCIGAATGTSPLGPFTPVPGGPLVCPGRADTPTADDTVPNRPIATAGVIDPSGFKDNDGARYLLYKTQQLPSSLRIVRLNAAGTHVLGDATSRQLLRSDRIVENPVVVRHGGAYILFASRGPYNKCSYETIWMRAPSLAANAFNSVAQHPLITPGSTDGVCGPGGADIAAAIDTGQRIFFHGWLCGSSPCPSGFDAMSDPGGRRGMYVGVLGWNGGNDPVVNVFLSP
ncbi:glycoside hydrolase family 43 protein [Pyxidicoccus xibeiensis]|uniref:glycoside hydrolase family 43 protein n=1 Tax=Pyxidicoccus xibeiensis TaxID=2906759 RepID=UPI0020A72994|nr:glycoside hydrolase family 43 protein [Pyxidicoccus xibeiensis]MCP3138070.1 glycoside hydrolase family 43 protein [Pyxidicoccus xibeiensis]